MKDKLLRTAIYTCLVTGSALISSNTYALCTAAAPACPVVNGNTMLAADCKGPLNITGDNLVLNLGGHSICDPNDDNNDDGIIINGRSNVTVINGTIEDVGENGIDIDNSSYISLQHLTVKDNDDYHGIEIDDSMNITLREIQLSNNEYEGIYVSGTDNISLWKVSSKDHYNDYGMYFDSTKRLNIVHAVVDSNEYEGIKIRDSTDTKVLSSTIMNNGQRGLESRYSTRFKFMLNKVSSNGEEGIYIHDNSTFGSILFNVALNNGNDDILNESNACLTNKFLFNVFRTKSGCVR